MLSATFLALAATAFALPQSTPPTTTSVLVCTGEDYTGDCTTLTVPFQICQQLSAPYLKNLGSFKPSAGSFCRITYTADSCTLHGDAFVDPTPGAPTLHTNFTDPATNSKLDAGSVITSFLCQACSGCS